jgi:hypothetical protein
MRQIGKFIADAGSWGLVSVVAAVVFFAIGIRDHAQDKPISAFVFVCLSVPLFWAGAYIAWSKKNSELNAFNEYPRIEIRVFEAFILPQDMYADCFVRISLHNNSNVRTIIPDYRLSISITGKILDGADALNDLGSYAVVAYDEDEERPDQLVRKSSTPLAPLSIPATTIPLQRGIPQIGWLHLRIRGVPKWPEHKEVVGSYQYYNEEGDELYEDVEEITMMAKNVESLELIAIDAFGKSHRAAAQGPFWSWLKRIERNTL